jgi:hypothetical protein
MNSFVAEESCALRRVLACLPVLGVLGLGLLPAEHLHVAETADGHHSQLIHRHFDRHPHHPTDTHAIVEHDGHEDQQAKQLDSLFTGPQASSQVHPPCQLLYERAPDAQLSQCASVLPPDVDTSAHDPPWLASSGLRAPPFPPV